jgi:hypothetical protein
VVIRSLPITGSFRTLQCAVPGVPSIPAHEILVRPALDNLTVFHDEDYVSVLDGRQPVGDHKDGTPVLNPHNRLLDHLFRLGV